MTQSIPSKRRYRSKRRQQQANETRRQIIEAAAKMFSIHGYAGATIDSIAQEAGVSSESIYAVFGNKRTVLTSLVDLAVAGDQRPVSLLQRAGPQAVLQEKDPVHLLNLFALDITGILERVAPVFEMIRMAAKTEPDIADLLKNLLEQRLQNLNAVARQLNALNALREDIDQKQVAETIWVITSPEVFSLLRTDRRWTQEQYIQWLSDTLTRLLLP